MDDLLGNPVAIWAIVATFLVFLEILIGAVGVGLLFMGLGAYIVALSLYVNWIAEDQLLLQFSIFFFATALFTIILWKPLKRLRNKKANYHDMQGQDVLVIEQPLIRAEKGYVKWSGVRMKAVLIAESEVERIEVGQDAYILHAKGNTLYVDHQPQQQSSKE